MLSSDWLVKAAAVKAAKVNELEAYVHEVVSVVTHGFNTITAGPELLTLL